MAFQDPGNQQYYPQPLSPQFESRGTTSANLEPLPNVRTDSSVRGGLETPRQVDYPVDRSLEKLFSGLGDSIGAVTKAGYEGIERGIEKQVYANVDAAQADIRAQSNAYLSGDVPLPNTKQNATALAVGKQAEDRGMTLMDAIRAKPRLAAAYWERLEQDAAGMRASKPEFRKEIDAGFSRATGHIPANAAQEARFAEISDIQRKLEARTDEDQKWISSKAKYIYQLPNYQELVATKNMGALRAGVLEREGIEHDLDERRKTTFSQYGKDKDGKPVYLDSKQLVEEATKDATQGASITISDFMKGVNERLPEKLRINYGGTGFRDNFNRGLEQGAFEPGKPEGAQALQTLELLRNQGVNQIDSWLKSPTPGGRSFEAIIGSTAAEQIRKNALSDMDSMIDALTKRQVGTAAFYDAANKAVIRKDVSRILGTDIGRVMGAAREVGGDNGVNLVMGNQKGAYPDFLAAITGKDAAGKMTNEPGTSVYDTSQKLLQLPNDVTRTQRNAAVKTMTDNLNKLTLDEDIKKNVPSVARANSIATDFANLHKFITDPKSRLDASEYVGFYKKMSSVKTTEGIYELRNDNPDAWTNYVNWHKTAFQAIMKDEIAFAKELTVNPNYTLIVNNETGQLTPFVINPSTGTIIAEARNDVTPQAQSVKRFNDVLRLIKPVIDKEKIPMDKFLEQAGIDFNAPKQSFWGEIGDAMKRSNEDMNKRLEENKTKKFPSNLREKRSDFSIFENEGVLAGGISGDNLEAAKPVLHKMVAKAETNGRYNALFGDKGVDEVDLSRLPVHDVIALQKARNKRTGLESSAAGAYQFMHYTLNDLKKGGKITGDELFTNDLQDELAMHLMERRGFSKYLKGNMTKETFINNLSKEWAGLPNMQGMSSYAGVGSNKATVSLPEVFHTLDALRDNNRLDR